ncbi:MAG TPA: Flp pilus assembly protein CpaB [Brevundimonas sp.]|nr:Flp pilus assembly protein CpaB [Citromicrobium sp.]MAS85072.1 Flp pilus assembly protein CpaB [Erythrobacteraceae bacterium]HAV51169.1 Flp pilus assembly protein CpaB [Brevundimonas sp.]MAO95940.1 Flp pilus assembly protein CpaB [Citromicrobium sp.]MBD75916.1 Flp pilus assembly protein CpaB [Citromicrobium sp.]|tara:strand:- start:6586 stop:7671 length:1086 start_codon:yes stop_codon:yes gene_type:complete
MDRKKLVLLLAALVIAAGTAFIARSMFAGSSAPEAVAATAAAQPTGPRVLVANRSLPVGTIITQDAIGFQAWPNDLVRDAYFIDGESDVSKLLGTVVRFQITAGEPVTQGALVAPGDRGFLAAALAPGMRAVTVPVNANTAVAGFVFPGDRIDLMMTHDANGLKATETILRNLRVLATDQSTSQNTVDGQTVARTVSTVTLEVTPKIAEKIAVAQTVGTLSLSLRSIADNSTDLERALASGDIKIPDNATPEEEARLLARARAMPSDTGSSYVTGADVSRFAIRSATQSSPSAPSNSGGETFTPTPIIQASNGVPVPSAPSTPSGPTVRVMRGEQSTSVAAGKTGGVKTDTARATSIGGRE